ncbi:PREDICTED: uncharacterized protein LOC104727256 [Camelina sativa]|uniref:Uncharacterized protein LOC104727256 n=1 Tax=Camelina sativa TaxID=90675 RepID=A0ABM0UQM1_CAMSA|nr:PREDICTED: uncharacterized protein LOC104727256 [Camelina sativa]
MKAKKEMKKESNLARLVKSPVRFLIMARDAYIRSMTSCSAGFIRGGGGCGSGVFGLPAGSFQICEAQSTALPRSFTLNSATTTRERCRFVSSGGEISVETTMAMRRRMDLRRNYSCAAMGRIDEDKVCDEFEIEESLFDYSKKRKIGGVFTTHQQ